MAFVPVSVAISEPLDWPLKRVVGRSAAGLRSSGMLDLLLHADVLLADFVPGLRPPHLRDPVRDHLRGDRPGRHTVPAGRLAALRGRRAGGDGRLPAGAVAAGDGGRRDRRQRRQLHGRPACRASLQARRAGDEHAPLGQARIRPARTCVLRAARRPRRGPRALRADRPHVSAVRRRRRRHVIRARSRSTT